ncbi:HEAT repeat domain-containing protein [Blastopirellula sp. J2-11]|uniref:HEAT repeat domain-containing protein n=1 Tax=Blastopirellula sp. J2-11 TaxID=2943192 RepID=UPI0021C90887|nr:HEAT repeat domain-containing protein [Blastopirellula sp. J2-11]UUO04353.1 HEAT repeat domain-containing protein [Blastopirellula sp. J2-11]
MMQQKSSMSGLRLAIGVLSAVVWIGLSAAPACAQKDDSALDQELMKSLGNPLGEIVDEAMPKEASKKSDAPRSDDAAMPEEASDEIAPLVLDEPLPGAIIGLTAGIQKAQIDQKPAFVIASGKSCPWCSRLKQEMRKPEIAQALTRWTLIEVDVDASPEDAEKLGVSAIPALRLLTITGQEVAQHDGYLTAAALLAWLEENHGAVANQTDNLLLSADKPNAGNVLRLIRHLDDRDPLIRQAAIGRLQVVPELAGEPLLNAFEEGSLAKRLAILEIFDQWNAPIDAIDPWRPEAINDQILARLREWTSQLQPQDAAVKELSAQEMAALQLQIDRLLHANIADGEVIAARLARYAEALLPKVVSRLQDVQTDEERTKLRALRYRLVANDALVLRFPGGLARLASTEALVRRQAATQLVGLASAAEQPLLLELFSDADPLIREIALRGLQNIGGEEATASLVKLLQDPEPNVRAAVLQQLAEGASPTLLSDVAAYVKTEKDADLLVHAIRYLREISQSQSAQALLDLLPHESWQVRAEAAEALKELDYEELGDNPELLDDLKAALIFRMSDDDPFVVSRAAEALTKQMSEEAIQPLFVAAERHPAIATEILKNLAYHTDEFPSISTHFRKLLEHEEPSMRIAAVMGLTRADAQTLSEWLPLALNDESAKVRIVGATALFQQMEMERENAKESILDGDSTSASFSRGSNRFFGLGNPFASGNRKKRKTAEEDEKPKSSHPWEIWLNKYFTGENRTEYGPEIIDPLTKMIESDDPEERITAALVLAPRGHQQTALPVILETVQQSPALINRALAILPWVSWEQRQELFANLYPLAEQEGQQQLALRAASSALDSRAAGLLWPLLEKENVDLEMAAGIHQSLMYAYFGKSYWYGGDLSASKREKIVTAAQQHAEAGGEMDSLVALQLLAKIDERLACQIATKIAEDPARPDALRRNAFHISLLLTPEEEQVENLLAAMKSEQTERRELAFEMLIAGSEDRSLYRIYDTFTFTWPYNELSINGPQGPIIPTLPPGLEIESVRPWMKHPSTKIRAYAGYVLALAGEVEGLDPLLEYWRTDANRNSVTNILVFRAISKLNASQHIDILRNIYNPEQFGYTENRRFYWTIRIMSGDEVLELRKKIRDEVGMSNLR